MVLSYTQSILNMVVGLFMSSFVLRQLGDTEYGVYQTITAFANYLILLEFGTGTVMTRNIAACRAGESSQLSIQKNISTIWSVTSGLACAILAVSVVFYCSIGAVYKNSLNNAQILLSRQMFVFITIQLVSTYLSQTLNGIMLGFEHYTYASTVSIIRIITRTTAIVLLLINIKSALLITVVDATLALVQMLITYVYCCKKNKVKINYLNFDKAILKSSLPMCIALLLQTIINQANNMIGKFTLGVMMTPEDVTLYSVALYVFSMFSAMVTIPVSLYTPQVTKNVVSGVEGLPLTKTLVQPSRLIVVIGGSILFGFIAAGRPFIALVYGRKYLSAWMMAVILMVPMFVNMTNSLSINVLDAKNKRLARSLILMVTTAINIGLTIVLIIKIGIIGAAIATGASMILQVIVINIYYSRVINIKVYYLYRHAYKGILLFQLFGAGAGWIVSNIIDNLLVSLLASGGVYVFVAFGGFLIFGKNDRELSAFNKMKLKFFKR